ncbi:MAG: ATP-binding protein [Muribaculum sp.]|nr:ATP-binding protein [Muribaculum sp.]
MDKYDSIEEQTQDYFGLFLCLQHWQQEEPEALGRAFEELWGQIAEKEENSEIFLPARYLRTCFELTETSYFLVMFAFCCELEGGLCLDFREKYHELRPNLQYALHLLSAVLPVDFEQIALLHQENGGLGDLLRLPREEAERGGLLLLPLVLNRTAFYFLLTGTLLEAPWYRAFLPGAAGGQNGQNEQLKLPGEEELLLLHEREAAVLRYHLGNKRPVRILLKGRRGVGKHTLLCRVCRSCLANTVFVKMDQLSEGEDSLREIGHILRLLCRLIEPVAVLELTQGWLSVSSGAERQAADLEFLLTESLQDVPVVLMAETAACARVAEPFANLWLEPAEWLTAKEREAALDLWLEPAERGDWQMRMLERYRLNIGEFREKQEAIRIWAETKHISEGSAAAWEAGLRETTVLSGLGRIIENSDASEEIVLSEECRSQLETVAELAAGWTGRQGLHLLFHGSSGTGKTMAASILARRLHLPLFKVDLSRIFDKYIGETEKHMDEIFHLAQKNRYLLFFDEADALFSRRTGIQDARDKYANVSTSYLLQRIEEYDGMLIMATNLLNHFDDAFVRRIRFVIKFRNLDEKGRALLWEKALTAEKPEVEESVSFQELARAAELSPARIRAAARVAGMLADCGKSGRITKEHLKKALELEAGKDETAVKSF